MGFAISRGVVNKPYRVVIYGPEGVGKTSLAACFPDPLFSDTEGSTLRFPIPRMEPLPTTWELLNEQAKYVRDNPSVCKTYVIDTADWAETLSRKCVCAKYKKGGIEDFGYGQGYTYAAEEFGKLLNVLNEIHDKGIHIVLNAHAAITKFEQPDAMGAYDRWELKMHKKIATQLKEWADMVLFCNFETNVVSQGNEMLKKKATGGKRVIYTEHTPSWDAKNRNNLPSKLPMDYESIRHIIEPVQAVPVAPAKPEPVQPKVEPAPDERVVYDANNPENVDDMWKGIPDRLAQILLVNKVQPEELMYVVEQEGIFPDDGPSMKIRDYPEDLIDGWVIAEWDSIYKRIKENREDTPF